MKWYLTAVVSTGALSVAILAGPARSAVTRVDLAVLRTVVDLRTPAATRVVRALDGLGSGATIRAIAWATIAVLLTFRRFEHLAAYLAVLLVGSFIETVVATQVGRIRPAGVVILGHWAGYAYPSRPVAGIGLVLAGVTYTLVPAGRWRRRMIWASGVGLGCLAAARLYLAPDHPSDVFAGVVIGWALAAMIFAWATPDDTFPVSYHHGRRAHLDIGGRRGQAIRQALDQQLGIAVDAVEPFGLGGSAGSTPLRLRVRRRNDSTSQTVMFAKLYALSHLRSDRSYKLARSILYGRLEDEKPFLERAAPR
jgi:hypothetical protein